jgi:hypothetical protein
VLLSSSGTWSTHCRISKCGWTVCLCEIKNDTESRFSNAQREILEYFYSPGDMRWYVKVVEFYATLLPAAVLFFGFSNDKLVWFPVISFYKVKEVGHLWWLLKGKWWSLAMKKVWNETTEKRDYWFVVKGCETVWLVKLFRDFSLINVFV